LVILDKPVFQVLPIKLKKMVIFVFDGVTPEYSYYLNEVNVSIVSFEDCYDSNSFAGEVDDASMVCAAVSTGGNDACSGDSGGPLSVVGQTATDDIQIGLTSFGDGCGLINYPTVYTRVSFFKEWIHENICQHSKMKCLNLEVKVDKDVEINYKELNIRIND
jgi:secreted trypsin-like serine protease